MILTPFHGSHPCHHQFDWSTRVTWHWRSGSTHEGHIVAELRSMVGLSPLACPSRDGHRSRGYATPPSGHPPLLSQRHPQLRSPSLPPAPCTRTRCASCGARFWILGIRRRNALAPSACASHVLAARASLGHAWLTHSARSAAFSSHRSPPPSRSCAQPGTARRGMRATLVCFTFLNFAAMAAMAMAYTFAPSTSSSVTIFDDGGGASPHVFAATAQLALPLLCLLALAVGYDFSHAHLPVFKQAKRLLGGVLGRHPRDGRPPPLGDT